MNRVQKKLVPSLEDISGVVLMVNSIDPQIGTIKHFVEAIQHLPSVIVLNKVDAITVTRAQEIMDELGADMLLASTAERRGLTSIKNAINTFPKGKIAILGIFNSGKTSLINCLTGDNAETGPIPGTTLIVTPHQYGEYTLLDTIGDIWDVNKPLMFSIDLSDCENVDEKITHCLEEETKGLKDSIQTALPGLRQAVTLCQEVIKNGGKLVISGAGASALIAQEMAGQAQETGTPVLVFTNEYATNAPISFAKGIGEDELAMARYAARAVNKGDVAIGISASGGTACVHDFLRLSREKGASTIAITENTDTPLGHYADVIIKSNAKPEGASSSKIQTAQLAIGHTLLIVLADERGLNAEDCIKNMLAERQPSKKMGLK